MNKQQLASKIWESANKMRSKIEANEYKDYILGFIFYKYLSDTEVKFCRENDFSDADIKALTEDDTDTVEFIGQSIGYFIAYDNLFGAWIEKGKDFDVSNVRDALSAFSRLINVSHRKVFDRILDTLQTGLSKLGDSSSSQTKAISDLIQLIKDIPMDGKQDYDVLGFIYEYLISMFAANAGKKAGEFYTPHEVSLLMSEVVAEYVKNRSTIDIYDPTSGSGSLLINLGRSVAKHIADSNNVKYYAQEIKENTYNLTRMNLVMRGILPVNIYTRNGDTLEDDWPFFDDSDPVGTYNPLYVDAVVSNPPYSQAWDPSGKDGDPRYAGFGFAPKTKADFAFLLHDLFHLKPDGIMTIVLPHGVLFRSGEEGEIRKNLIEKNHIDTIIGLPANIFFGTGIPTIIMVLKKPEGRKKLDGKKDTDVLIIDASKGFAKVGKNNQLRASDIKKIADTAASRISTPKFSRLVSQQEIRDNEYNLNIPRYVDSSEGAETWDIYASMFGGIPKSEIDLLDAYWQAFCGLRDELFDDDSSPYCGLAVENTEATIKANVSVQGFKANYEAVFADFADLLKTELIDGMQTIDINKEETALADEIFGRIAPVPLVDKYSVYQALDDEWTKTAIDLEIIQTEGFAATKKVNPNMVLKKKDGKDQEVQDGWIGHVIPFELVQATLLKEDADALRAKKEQLAEITSTYEEVIGSLSEEEKSTSILNGTNDAFVFGEVKKALKSIIADIDTPEITALRTYIDLLDEKVNKPEKERFIAEHSNVNWANIEANKDGTYGKGKVNAYIKSLQAGFTFDVDSYESKIVKIGELLDEEKELKATVKEESAALHLKTKTTIEGLSDAQVLTLLEQKWIAPLMATLHRTPDGIIADLVAKVRALADKYAVTYAEVAEQIAETKSSLSVLIDDLTGNDFDMKGLGEFQSLLRGENHE
ncbi:MAG: type I restriction-modification system subunit M [Mycoplasmataceae bacterium]|jgi:type I restriction enzyme M protein|nr:type I restriction-modification system subunit M [Mycoplasmataceae bacterium]